MLETYCTRMELRLKRSFKFQYKQKKKNETWNPSPSKQKTGSPIAQNPHRSPTLPSPIAHSPHRSNTVPSPLAHPFTDLRQLSPISHSPHRYQPTLTDLKLPHFHPMWIPFLPPLFLLFVSFSSIAGTHPFSQGRLAVSFSKFFVLIPVLGFLFLLYGFDFRFRVSAVDLRFWFWV